MADQSILSSRAIVGMYFERLTAQAGMEWINDVSNYFTSDQPIEVYPWLGMVPVLREWIGGRQAKALRSEDKIEIVNRHFEATLEFALRDLRRDKTPQIQARISEFVDRSTTHWASLLSTLILNGASSKCYDGQNFFSDSHKEGKSGTLSNSITVDISTLPITASNAGTVNAPCPEVMQQAILSAITQMMTFKDDQGEPINETAQAFRVIVPVGLMTSTRSALSMVKQAAATVMDMSDFRIAASVNTRLTAGGWTDKFVVFRTDGALKSLIRQEETKPDLKVKDEMSEYAFDNDAIQIGLDTWRNVGYGRWQGAVLAQLV